MWNLLNLSLRVAAAIAGAFCLLTAFLAYPAEEGQMQSVLEHLWAEIDDRQKAALSLHAAFMQQVVKSVSHLFDRLFGHKLFSSRCVGISISYSVASVCLAWILTLVWPDSFDRPVDRSYCALLGCISIAYLFIGTIPVLFAGFRFIKTWLLFILVSACALYVLAMDAPEWYLSGSLITYLASSGLPALGASFGCDVLFIAATRQILRWAGEMKQSYKIVALLLLNCLFALGLVLTPYLWAYGESWGELARIGASATSGMPRGPVATDSHPSPIFVDLVLAVSASNAIDLIAASIFILLAALLLVHRALWPLLNRSIFRLQEIGAKGRRAILIGVGLMLLGAGTSGTVVGWAKRVSEFYKG